MHAGYERVAVDEVELEGQDTEQQVAVRYRAWGGHRSTLEVTCLKNLVLVGISTRDRTGRPRASAELSQTDRSWGLDVNSRGEFTSRRNSCNDFPVNGAASTHSVAV